MLKRIGTSLIILLAPVLSFGQLPSPNDTLDNGKKVPFNQFLGRFSVFNEGFGAGVLYSLNLGYSLIKTDLILLDLTIGANRMSYGSNPQDTKYDTYRFPVGLSMYLGRRRSRLNARLGYNPEIYPSWYGDSDSPYPNCAGICPSPAKHSFFLSLGYTYQNQYGFFIGANAYGMMFLPRRADVQRWGYELTFAPWAGLAIGYRLPSKQLHKEWRERGFKRRVLRLEQPKEKPPKKGDEIDDVFYNDTPLEVDSLEMLEIEERLAKLKTRHNRFLKEEARLNGRSLVFAEFFGATGIWSVNYAYTHPIARSNTFMMEYRGGFGTDNRNMSMPFHVGVKAMKNYRGTGVFVGVEPSIDWRTGKVGAIYFLEHNVEFHFAYGFSGGVAFYLFFDPAQYKYYEKIAPYAGFFFGYRLPQMKKRGL